MMFGKYGPLIAVVVFIAMMIGIHLIDKYFKNKKVME